MYVHGPSGIGKTALVQRFFDREVRGERVVALRSRCHERESVPYKGLDGVIDALSRHLSGLTRDELTTLVPADAAALARLFPVMQRAIAGAIPVLADTADPLDRFRFHVARRSLVRGSWSIVRPWSVVLGPPRRRPLPPLYNAPNLRGVNPPCT